MMGKPQAGMNDRASGKAPAQNEKENSLSSRAVMCQNKNTGELGRIPFPGEATADWGTPRKQKNAGRISAKPPKSPGVKVEKSFPLPWQHSELSRDLTLELEDVSLANEVPALDISDINHFDVAPAASLLEENFQVTTGQSGVYGSNSGSVHDFVKSEAEDSMDTQSELSQSSSSIISTSSLFGLDLTSLPDLHYNSKWGRSKDERIHTSSENTQCNFHLAPADSHESDSSHEYQHSVKRLRTTMTDSKLQPRDSISLQNDTRVNGQGFLELPNTLDVFLGPVRPSHLSTEAIVAYRPSESHPTTVCLFNVNADLSVSTQEWQTEKSSTKDRWQIFAVCKDYVVTAAQNAATVTFWRKKSAIRSGLPGLLECHKVEDIFSYPHCLDYTATHLYVGGRNSHYDDIKQEVPTGTVTIFRDTGNGYQQCHTVSADVFDAVAQIAANDNVVAVGGFPRHAISYDRKSGKRQCALQGLRAPILIIDGNTGEEIATFDAHSDVITQLVMDAGTLYSGSFDNSIKVWALDFIAGELNTQLLYTYACCLPTSLAPISGAVGSLMSASLDGVIRYWRANEAQADAVNLIEKSSKLTTPINMVVVNGRLFSAHNGRNVYNPSQFCGMFSWNMNRTLHEEVEHFESDEAVPLTPPCGAT